MQSKYFSFIAFSAFLSLLFLGSCDKKKDGNGSVFIEFDNRAGSAKLAFNTDYTTANGDIIQIKTFNYYVSNFVLVKTDGSEVVLPKDDCYFLIKENEASSKMVELKNVPAGEYKAVKFIIGVDSLKSVAPESERTGALDPTAHQMYWTWNSGYIFYKLEGLASNSPTGDLIYHVGGFGGFSSPTVNAIRNVSLSSPKNFTVSKSKSPELHVYADALKVFYGETTIDVKNIYRAHGGPSVKTLANNYKDMFMIHHVH